MDDTLDVDDILNASVDAEFLLRHDIDEEAILGLNDNEAPDSVTAQADAITTGADEKNVEEPPVLTTTSVSSTLIDADDAEQLDYEEDVITKPPEAPQPSQSDKPEVSVSSSKENKNEMTQAKCYVNPKFASNLQGSSSSGTSSRSKGPPSLLSTVILRPSHMTVSTNFTVPSAGMVGHFPRSSMQLQPPRVSLPGQNVAFRPNIPPPLVGGGIRLPGPLPLTLPPASFPPRFPTASTSALRPPFPHFTRMPPPLMNAPQDAANWDLMVDAFVKKANSDAPLGNSRSRKRSRSSSYSDRSRSYSSSSYSSFSSASRSPSRSPRRYRRHSPDRRRRRSRNNNYSRRRQRSPYRRRDGPRREEDIRRTIECAAVVGLDQDYLKKIEEQKRLREEIARRKSQKRQEIYGRNENGASYSKRPKTFPEQSRRRADDRSQLATTADKPRDAVRCTTTQPAVNGRKRDTEHSAETSVAPPTESKTQKLKPYLAVVVNNLKNLSAARQLANKVGQIKKMWQTENNAVSIIFEKHEHAKHFMLQYHAKPFSGEKLDVSLEKVFLNLATIP